MQFKAGPQLSLPYPLGRSLALDSTPVVPAPGEGPVVEDRTGVPFPPILALMTTNQLLLNALLDVSVNSVYFSENLPGSSVTWDNGLSG